MHAQSFLFSAVVSLFFSTQADEARALFHHAADALIMHQKACEIRFPYVSPPFVSVDMKATPALTLIHKTQLTFPYGSVH